MKILVIDDDLDLCAGLQLALSHESTVVDFAHDGNEGLRAASVDKGNKYDAIILDNNLPKQNGISVCSQLRSQNIHTPILVLSVTDNEDAKVNFLDIGADDYLPKPFSARELSARLRALVRRGPQLQSTAIKVGELVLDTVQQTASFGRHSLHLPRKQYLILEYLIRHSDQAITRQALAEHVWGDRNLDLFSNALEAHMCELRKRLRTHTSFDFIHTLNGRGYKFTSKT